MNKFKCRLCDQETDEINQDENCRDCGAFNSTTDALLYAVLKVLRRIEQSQDTFIYRVRSRMNDFEE